MSFRPPGTTAPFSRNFEVYVSTNKTTRDIDVHKYHPSHVKSGLNPVKHRRNRKLNQVYPYISRSIKICDLPTAARSMMDNSNNSLMDPTDHVEIMPYDVALLTEDIKSSVTCSSGLESVFPVEALMERYQNTGYSMDSWREQQMQSEMSASLNTILPPPQTVIIDGKSYNLCELIEVINRLRKDVQACTERIVFLEAELSKTRAALTSREQDVHKLRSVLEQKVQSPKETSLDPLLEHPTEEIEEISGQFQPPRKMERIKKQGVSGESRDQSQTMDVIHFHKESHHCELIRQAIQKNDFLRHLDKSQVDEIVRCMYKKFIPQGCYIIREGQTGDALYVVADGLMEVSKNGKILGQMEVGRAFGELALLYNCKRTASVRAVTRASAWTLDRQVFQQIMMSSHLHEQKENIQFLSSVPALKGLTTEKLHKLADVVEPVSYGPNEYIIREGEIGETFYIIKTGTVRVTKAISKERDDVYELRQLGPGDWFGEKALYTSENRSANVISMDMGVQLLSLDRSNFIHLIGDLNEIKSKDYGDEEASAKTALRDTDLVPRQLAPHAVTPEAASFEFGPKLERSDFTTIAVIGTGGFGCVELVLWNRDSSRSFALKKMKKQHIVQTRQQEHIRSERQLMLRIRSPFICRLYTTFKDNKYVYMVLEACLGGELWTLLRNCGRFNDTVTRFAVACVLEAFKFLHTHGIIYRDLKPENLLLDEKGYIKLCDFGFAKHIGMGKKTWTFCGTPEYVAPEIILNKGHDYSADYWSLGVLIFELLTGSPPFTGSDPMKIYNVVLRGIDSIEFPASHIGRTASSLIRRLCAQIPAQRLGYGHGGVIEIKQNKYFQGFDWIGLHRRTLVAPIQPKISGPCDVSNFDKYPADLEDAPEELSGWDEEF